MQQTGHGSGSGATTTAHENVPGNGVIKPMVGPDAGGGSGSNQSPDATVEGQVWLDNNGDGKLNNNELGFSGIKVELDVEGQGWFYTTTDDAKTGVNYSFPVYVPEGTMIDYQITVVIPPNDWATIQGTDSVINSSGISPIYTLAPGDVADVPAGLRSMNVTTLQDDAAAPIQNQITLRDAIQTGNNGPPVPAVTFQGDLSGTISLQAALPAVQKSYNIDGPGAKILNVQGNGNSDNPYRIFTINNGITTTISGLTISNGFVQNDNGGGILNKGTLKLYEDTVQWNQAANLNLQGGNGGGIYNSNGAELTIQGGWIYKNKATIGGGLYNAGGIVRIQPRTLISANAASLGGGGISNSGGSISVNSATVYGNSDSGYFGAGVENKSGNFVMGGGAITSNTEVKNGGGGVFNSGTMTLTGLSIANNQASSLGGGIYVGAGKLTLTSVTIGGFVQGVAQPNKATDGGGMFIRGGTVKMSQGVVSANSAVTTPGGFLNPSGGGVYVTSGSLTLTKVSIKGNKAKINGGGLDVEGGTVNVTGGSFVKNYVLSNNGGGIYVGGGTLTIAGKANLKSNYLAVGGTGNGGGMYVYTGRVNMSGGSISGNSVPKNSNGAGIYVNFGTLTLKGNLQIIKNFVATGGTGNGGGMYIYGGTVNVSNSGRTSMGIDSNSANSGGGIYNYGGSLTLKVEAMGVENNIITNQGGGLYLGKRSTTNFAAFSTLVKGNTIAGGARNGVYWQNVANVLNQGNLNDGDDLDGKPLKGP